MSKIVMILAILVGIVFIFAGGTKLTGPQEMIDNFHRFGYTTWFMYLIGAAEVAAGIGLMVPKIRGWAATILIFIMAGAVYSHYMHDPISAAVPAVILGALCAFIASKSPASRAV